MYYGKQQICAIRARKYFGGQIMRKVGIFVGLMVLLSFAAVSAVSAQSSIKADFGKYPADFGVAYSSMIGFYPVPTMNKLFGAKAPFATSFQGIPAVITLEKASGTAKEFSAQLLLTLKVPETGDMKGMRLLVTFQADSTSEMSYCRYIKLVNLIDGSITEQRSNGSQNSDGTVIGIFFGVMEYFWDVSKLKE
jgi:hypothetical protein